MTQEEAEKIILSNLNPQRSGRLDVIEIVHAARIMANEINRHSANTPVIPPDDYKGSQANWMVKLQERGLWNGKGWYGDIMIASDELWEILEECEGDE